MLCLMIASITGPARAQQSAPAPVISDTAKLRGPRQPIFFRHDIHAGQDKIPCLYCHSTVTVSSEPGIPAVQDCMGCHLIIGGSTETHQAEIQKVREAWFERSPPEWIRVHAVPGFVRFPHMRHIKVLGEETPGAARRRARCATVMCSKCPRSFGSSRLRWDGASAATCGAT